MMERNKLIRAMTELPDDLLLEAEQVSCRRKPVIFRRVAAVAAVAAMLAVTVYAAVAGITWNVDKEPVEAVVEKYGDIAWDYYKDYDGTQEFEKLEYTVPLEKVQLKESCYREMEELLRRYWNMAQRADYGQSFDLAPEQEIVFDSDDVEIFFGSLISQYLTMDREVVIFRTLEDVEEVLGVKLAVTDQLRSAIRSASERGWDHVLSLRIYTGVTVGQMLESECTLTPERVVINYQLGGYCTNGRVSGTISIPLTEESARQGLQGLHYSYEKEGPIWQEQQTVGGQGLMLFGNDPEAGYDGWAIGVYTDNGIGYTIHARRDADIPYYTPGWRSYESAKAMVLSLLEAQK